jgi:allantoinase
MRTTSRRGFLKGAGVAGAALAVPGALAIPQVSEAQGRAAGGRGLKISELDEGHYKVRRQPIEWPNKARIAVTWVVNFEGKTDATTSYDIAYTDYSCKAGFWRLLKIFEDNGVKGTWYTNGIIATRYPETLKELVRLGHEIDGHNWANNIPMTTISPEDERELVHRVFSDVEKVSGYQIPGWMGSGEAESSTTMDYLADERYIWNGDFSTDDIPYTVMHKGKKTVVIPYQRESNDTQISGRRYHPSVWLQKFKDQFDVMYEEGVTYPQYLSAATHAWILAHPAGSKAVEEAIQYAAGFPDVWNTTEVDIARYWLKKNYD